LASPLQRVSVFHRISYPIDWCLKD
jgi:hypothetical protein